MSASLPTTIKPTHTGLTRSTKTRILVSKLGDGYRQRSGDGLNMVIKEYDVRWVSSNTNIDELVTHFEEREGYQDFTWTPPDGTTEYKFTCEEWSRTNLAANVAELTAHLKQEFDL